MKPHSTTAFLLGLFFSSLLLLPAHAASPWIANRPVQISPAAPSSQGLSFAGHVGGTPNAIAVSSTYLYAGLGSELAILDVADPAMPSQVGQIMLGMIQKLVVVGSRLYVAADKLYVLDLSNPAAPVMIGSLDVPGDATDLAIMGTVAYITSQGILHIVNIADPAAPSEVGIYSSSYISYRLDRVAVVGHYAYLNALSCGEHCSSGLEIVDVADPAHATLVIHDDQLGGFDELVFSGSYGYVATGGSFDVWNIADPAHPVIGSQIAVYAARLSVAGSRVYVADTDQLGGGLRVYDISNPANPVQQGFYTPPGVIAALAGTGRYAYVYNIQDGLEVVDTLNPALPTRVGGLTTLIDPWQVTVQNSRAYVVEHPLSGDTWKQQPNGVKIVDISDPGHALVVGVYRPAGARPNMLAIAGNYAYVATQTEVLTETGTLNIVNIADPAHPAEVAVYKIPGASGVASGPIEILDHYAYVVNQGKIYIVDIADPAHPQLAGTYAPDQAGILCMVQQNGYIYLGLDNGAMEVVDATHPATPVRAGTIATQYYAIDIAVSGQYVYMVSGLASDIGALYAIDVSNPASPKQAGRFDLDITGQIAVITNTAYITARFGGTGGVRVIDTSDPASLHQTSFYGTGTAIDITISGAFISTAAEGNGLFILQALTLTPRVYLPLPE